MARHRNIRSMNVNEEYEGYDDVYGHSVEDDYCVSPSEAAFMYDREGSKNKQKIGAFFQSVTDIAEENEGENESKEANLSDIDKARLESCVDQIRQVVSSGIPRQELVNIILLYDFNVEKAINFILGCPQYNHITEKKDDILYKKSFKNFTIPKLNTKASMNFKREPLKIDSSSFSSLNELSRSHLKSVVTTPANAINFKDKPRFSQLHIGKMTDDSRTTRSRREPDDILDNCHIDLTKALRGVTSAPQLRASQRKENLETFTPTFVDCEIVLQQSETKKPVDIFNVNLSRRLSKNIRYKKVSTFGKVLCLHYSRPVPFISHKSDSIYSGISQFLFDCPSPDDIRIGALHSHLKLQKKATNSPAMNS